MTTRRQFLHGHAAAISGLALQRMMGLGSAVSLATLPSMLLRADAPATRPWLRKTLKIGMIRPQEASLQERFAIALQAGFEGVELNTGEFDPTEAVAAAQATGLVIDGTVNGDHWQVRHTDPDPNVRKLALASLQSGIEETAAVGADTMLLVPGHGKDGDDDVVYRRALENITLALPAAEKHGVMILIENVWNHFLYDHEGGGNQSADRLAKFVDDFDSPWVGVQFDIGNHWKFGDPADWIRTLGDRIKKLDIKGFSRDTDKFTPITQGDIDWPSVEAALRDIGFTGWVAAEVGGGDLEHLRTVSVQMEAALNCSQRVPVVD